MSLKDYFRKYEKVSRNIEDLERYLEDEYEKVEKIERQIQQLVLSTNKKDESRKSRLVGVIAKHKVTLQAAKEALEAKKQERDKLGLEIQNEFLKLLDKKRVELGNQLDQLLRTVSFVEAANPEPPVRVKEVMRLSDKVKWLFMDLLKSQNKQVISVERIKKLAIEFGFIKEV